MWNERKEIKKIKCILNIYVGEFTRRSIWEEVHTNVFLGEGLYSWQTSYYVIRSGALMEKATTERKGRIISLTSIEFFMVFVEVNEVQTY